MAQLTPGLTTTSRGRVAGIPPDTHLRATRLDLGWKSLPLAKLYDYTKYYTGSTTTTRAWLQMHEPEKKKKSPQQHNCQGYGQGAMSPPTRGTAEAPSTLAGPGV